MSGLRLGFAGTPAFAATILAGMIAAGQTPVIVYTQPDRPSGRGRKLRPGPVKELAVAQGIPVLQPTRLRGNEASETMAGLALDVLVVAAYGIILPPDILARPRYGCINVHASLLPRWRGAAPIERAIMAGDAETGVSIMLMDAGLDTGPVYLTRTVAIDAQTTGTSLEDALAIEGTTALLDCLAKLPDLTPVAQDDAGACYAPKLSDADAEIDWSLAAETIDRQIRALSGRLPARAFIADARVQLLAADLVPATDATGGGADPVTPGTIIEASPRGGILVACGQGCLRIRRLQLNRGKGTPMDAAAALNGYADLFRPGQRLLSQPG